LGASFRTGESYLEYSVSFSTRCTLVVWPKASVHRDLRDLHSYSSGKRLIAEYCVNPRLSNAWRHFRGCARHKLGVRTLTDDSPIAKLIVTAEVLLVISGMPGHEEKRWPSSL
jgi:hypothetical protein